MIEYAEWDGTVLQDLSINSNVFVKEVTGLSGVPGIRGDTYDRPQGDGEVEPDNQFFRARTSTWKCAVFGDSQAVAWANWLTVHRTLVKAMRQPRLLKWRPLGTSINLQAMNRLAMVTPPIFSASTHGPQYLWDMVLRAADPINYDQNLQTQSVVAPATVSAGIPFPVPWPVPWSTLIVGSGAVNVTNDGDVEAWPVIDVTGPIQNPVVQNQNTGLTLYFDGLTLALGETLHIVTAPNAREATVNGVSKFSAVRYTSSEFPYVNAGATESIVFYGGNTDLAATQMTVYLRSAYMV